jgi:uncharacterized membrane protein YbhN (UPF0104 family)
VRSHVSVRVVLPLLVALGLLAYVSSVAVARQSGDQLLLILGQTWWLVLLLTFPYLAARLLVWHILLRQLRITIPWRQMTVAFAAGELTKSLPAGVYVQVFLLGQLSHFHRASLVRSTLATTAMLGLESLIAIPLAIVVGVPGQPWVSSALFSIVGAWLVALAVTAVLVRAGTTSAVARRVPWLAGLLPVANDALAAARELLSPQTLRAVPPTAVYMAVYVVDLYAILIAAGIHSLSIAAVMGTYALMVLAVILIPIPTELGITEITGLNLLLAYGLPRSAAAIVILSLRLLTTGMTILVASVILIALRAELRPLASDAPQPREAPHHTRS